jgi:hypothetical protein
LAEEEVYFAQEPLLQYPAQVFFYTSQDFLGEPEGFQPEGLLYHYLKQKDFLQLLVQL